MSRVGLAVAAFLVVVAVGGGILLLIARNDPKVELGYDDDVAVVEEWCDNTAQALGAEHPFASFGAVVDAATAGDLVEPTEPPPTTEADLAAWEERHAAYVDASYLAALDGAPGEVAMADAVLESSLEEASAGTTLTYPADLRRAAAKLDGYRAEHC